jgi:hypothetical protein
MDEPSTHMRGIVTTRGKCHRSGEIVNYGSPGKDPVDVLVRLALGALIVWTNSRIRRI